MFGMLQFMLPNVRNVTTNRSQAITSNFSLRAFRFQKDFKVTNVKENIYFALHNDAFYISSKKWENKHLD